MNNKIHNDLTKQNLYEQKRNKMYKKVPVKM